MPDYRIGSFTRPSDRAGAKPIVVYYAKLPLGGDVSGEIGWVIAAIEFDLRQLDIQIDSVRLALWVKHFVAMTGLYDSSRIDFRDNDFVYARISNALLDEDPLEFDSEDEFVTALNLPTAVYRGG